MKNYLLFLLTVFCLITFFGCEKEVIPLSLTTTTTSLKSSQTFNLVLTPDTTGCVYESENSFIASVSSTGVITARRVGETNIIIKNSAKGFTAKCKVTVTPQYNLFKEPCLTFGATKSTIKSYEKRTINIENSTSLIYNGENQYLYLSAYSFENSLYTINLCFVPNTYASLLGSFVAERYVLVSTDLNDNSFAMISPDQQIIVIVKVFSTLYSYVGYSASGLTSQKIKSMKSNAEFIERVNVIESRINTFNIKNKETINTNNKGNVKTYFDIQMKSLSNSLNQN